MIVQKSWFTSMSNSGKRTGNEQISTECRKIKIKEIPLANHSTNNPMSQSELETKFVLISAAKCGKMHASK